MSASEDSRNVINLRVIPKEDPVPSVEEIAEQLDTLDPEQRLVVDAIAQLGKFLMDNRDHIKYFVTVVAYRENAEASQELSFNVMTSPIDLAQYALALKIIENSFLGNLNARNPQIE